MPKKEQKTIIEGITEKGDIFHPRDWAERMSGQLSTFKKRRIHYSPLLQPSTHHGNKCIILDEKLKQSNPELHQSIINFAKKNKLKMTTINGDDQDETKKD